MVTSIIAALVLSDYYPNCEILFMSLANIHTIRKSFLALRTICATSPDQPGFVVNSTVSMLLCINRHSIGS